MSTSRRDFLATSLGALASAAFVRPGLARVLLRPGQEPAFTPIRRGVGYFTMRGGTIGYLVNNDGVVVVDTQFPESAEAFLKGLNTRSNGRPVDILLNTHHHGDHTGGNSVFRGVARRVVAHEKAAEHLRNPPGGGQAPANQLFPDTTFSDRWSADVGDERITARYYGRAHTSGDAVITFERANVVHMGDLMFHQRHPVVDRAAGATIRNWMRVLERTVQDHDADTVYIFGHANTGLPVVGGRAELQRFRDYFEALLTFVETQVRAGRSREEILATPGPLPGFEAYGPFGQPNPRSALVCAYEEVVEGLA
ncbi:MAG TPA: MBL fold metallo-hydrolase [Longimicrobiales bacterium]